MNRAIFSFEKRTDEIRKALLIDLRTDSWSVKISQADQAEVFIQRKAR